MISLHLMKSSEVRIAGDRSKYIEKLGFQKELSVRLEFRYKKFNYTIFKVQFFEKDMSE